MDTPTKLTHHARIYGPNGQPRYVSVSLPYVSAIADLPSYQAPPSSPKVGRGAYMTVGRVRAALGQDRAYSERLRDRIGFEAVTSRIAREGF